MIHEKCGVTLTNVHYNTVYLRKVVQFPLIFLKHLPGALATIYCETARRCVCVMFETGAGVVVDMLQRAHLAAAPVNTKTTRSNAALVSLGINVLRTHVSVSITFIANGAFIVTWCCHCHPVGGTTYTHIVIFC